jgi:hypothetical protein
MLDNLQYYCRDQRTSSSEKGPPTSQHTKLVYETPLFVGQGIPSPRPRDLTSKVYEHTYPTLTPFGFEPVTS